MECFADVPLVALMTTANELVQQDFMHALRIKGKLKQSFNGTNLKEDRFIYLNT